MVPEKFKKWLHVQIFSKKEEGACYKLVVQHCAGKSSSQAGQLPVPKPESIPEAETEERVQVLAMEAWDIAQTDADGFKGMQTYAILAFFEGDSEKPLARYTARFDSRMEEEEGNDDESVSEPPNKTGLVSQAMRHAEAFARIGTQASIHQLSMQQRTIESQQRLIEALTAEKMEMMQTMEDLSSKRHERQIETMEKEASLKLKTEALNRLSAYFPLIAKKFGMPMLPAKTGDKSSPGVREFLATVTPEQMGALQGVLTDQQQSMLVEMMMEQQAEEPTH